MMVKVLELVSLVSAAPSAVRTPDPRLQAALRDVHAHFMDAAAATAAAATVPAVPDRGGMHCAATWTSQNAR